MAEIVRKRNFRDLSGNKYFVLKGLFTQISKLFFGFKWANGRVVRNPG